MHKSIIYMMVLLSVTGISVAGCQKRGIPRSQYHAAAHTHKARIEPRVQEQPTPKKRVKKRTPAQELSYKVTNACADLVMRKEKSLSGLAVHRCGCIATKLQASGSLTTAQAVYEIFRAANSFDDLAGLEGAYFPQRKFREPSRQTQRMRQELRRAVAQCGRP
ncbi:MAG TPA: hypothetical protein ENJ46_00165 [Hellea balneolensis]|uniref:Uncharacterized protein n=1 Tax=Hellea balneolensis TaxID=287478 RepID=A0A7C3C227_9PROT|nr:hypothetical protein [Hellea balneolensis]